LEITFRFDYGNVVPWVRQRNGVLSAVAGPNALALRCPLGLYGKDKRTVSRFKLAAGQSIPCVLAWYPSHCPMPPPRDAHLLLEETTRWWKGWSARCNAPAEYRDVVLRSAITLKALTHRDIGGIVAAPTTSLPEQPGGVRNWDYRYCWVRDATFTLYALLTTGYTEEAAAWRQWLIRSVAGEPSTLQIMYGLGGERRLEEFEIPWLRGFDESRPVRIGNAAHAQRQMDVYGEITDVLYNARERGLEMDDDAWRIQLELLKFLEKEWDAKESGLWEQRGPERHFTFSRIMSWVAFDRAVKTVERFGLSGPVTRWKRFRRIIHEDVCRHGYDRKRKAFVQYYGGKPLDASLLLIPLVGFLPVTDPRVSGTVDAIQRELMKDGFVYRYSTEDSPDGLPMGEGAFLVCSFWLADNLVLMGRKDEARELFERVLSIRNDVGLLSEEYDPVGKRMLGNFPQAFSHVGMINTARNLSRAVGPAQMRSEQKTSLERPSDDVSAQRMRRKSRPP
jgi:GH15 family glucan-1,4-alpha-glucosidase